MSVIEFLAAQMCSVQTARMMQYPTELDLTSSCLSPTTMEMINDTSQTLKSLRNVLQIEALFGIEFTETHLTICMETWIYAACHLPSRWCLARLILQH
jgi:hypothetical protein